MICRSIVLLALCLFLAASASEIEKRSVDSQSQAQTGDEKDRTALLQGQITVARKVSVAGRRPSHDAFEGTKKEEAEQHACSDDIAGHAGCPDQGDGTNLLQSRVFVAHTPAHEDVGDSEELGSSDEMMKARKLLQLGSHDDLPPIGVPTDDAGRLNLVQQKEMSSTESENDTGLTDNVSDASELKTWGTEVTEPSNKSQSSDDSQEEREMREAYVVTEALAR